MVFAGGSYSTSLVTRAPLCARIPADLSFTEAATMPCVYSTVIHSTVHLGKLSKGQVCYASEGQIERKLTIHAQSILIQSACGGIGLAAIQIAQMIGATVSKLRVSGTSTLRATDIRHRWIRRESAVFGGYVQYPSKPDLPFKRLVLLARGFGGHERLWCRRCTQLALRRASPCILEMRGGIWVHGRDWEA